MSAVYLMLISLCVFALAYRYYAAFIGAKVLMLDDRNITPSVSCNDGRDYVPTNKWVVFGHHFAAIAGAGPFIGPDPGRPVSAGGLDSSGSCSAPSSRAVSMT